MSETPPRQRSTARLQRNFVWAAQKIMQGGLTVLVCYMQITLRTKDVLIECTGTDLTKAGIVLNTMVTMFSEYCSTPFEIEPVEVVDSFGQAHGEQLPTLP